MSVRDTFVNVNGLRFHGLEWGTPGPRPVVLLHGLRGHARSWDDVSAALGAEHHVLALDQRGRGDTSWAPDGDYTTEAYVADLGGFVDALGLPPFVLVGHSMGGRNAMMYAARYPERVTGLVIVDVGPEIEPRGAARMAAEIQNAPEEVDSLEILVAVSRPANPWIGETALRRRLQYQTKQLPNGKLGWRYDLAIRQQWRSGTRPAAPDFWAICREIRCPTLILRGRETDILARPVAERMLEVIPESRLVEIPRAGHMVYEDNPDDTIVALRAFLDARTAASTRGVPSAAKR